MQYEVSQLPIDLTSFLDPIKPGAQWSFEFNLYDDNEVLEVTTGWTAAAMFRADVNAPDTLASLTTSAGIVNNNAGNFKITLTAAQTTAFGGVRQCVFDLYVTNGSITDCPFQGTIEVLPRVTR